MAAGLADPGAGYPVLVAVLQVSVLPRLLVHPPPVDQPNGLVHTEALSEDLPNEDLKDESILNFHSWFCPCYTSLFRKGKILKILKLQLLQRVSVSKHP